MENPKTDEYFFKHALNELEILHDYVNEVDDFNEFISDQKNSRRNPI